MSNETKPTVGRPKGATDTTPRKKRTDHEVIAKPGEIAAITNFNVMLMEQPAIDNNDITQVEARIVWYLKTCIENDIRPGVAGLCLALGIDRTTWFRWGAGNYREPTYKELALKTKAVMESIMEQYMLQGKINPASGIFLLKNNFGYADTSEVVITPNTVSPLGEQQDVEALKQKYLENTYGIAEELPDNADTDIETTE